MHTQLVVLGGGPGGYAAAFLAADAGMSVTLVEADQRLGGTCLLRGCIPSKALLHVARVMDEVGELHQHWGVHYGTPSIDLAALRARKEEVIDKMSGGLKQLAQRRKVTWIQATGTLDSSTSLRLDGEHESIPTDRRIDFERLVIATGSIPAIPPSFDIGSSRVMDSSAALELSEIPETMLVIGGGYIGLEMATVYASLGCRVSVVELTDGLLPGADRDLVKPLHKRLQTLLGERIYLNTRVGSLGDRGDKVEVAFEGPGKFGVEFYERVLVAVGRRPNTRQLGLEHTQATVDKRGFIVCDRSQQTQDPHIWAIGDVAGEPMLAHKASHEARVAVESILGDTAAEFNPTAIPAVVFTDPEIAWAGITEEEAKRQGRSIEVSHYPWAASGRAQATGRVEGFTKWIVDPTSDRVIGCGIVGPGAGELISESVLAIEMGCDIHDVGSTIHPHPTMSETLMNAAEAHLGKAVEIYKPRRPRA